MKMNLTRLLRAIALAMTIVLFTTPAAAQRVNVCQHWLDNWRAHVGPIPGANQVPAVNSNGEREWLVTAPGAHTVHGQAWCHTSGTTAPTVHDDAGVHCWCRLTEPSAGPWVFFSTSLPGSGCTLTCAFACALCILNGYTLWGPCTRTAMLDSLPAILCETIAALDNCPADYLPVNLPMPPADECNTILQDLCDPTRGTCDLVCIPD